MMENLLKKLLLLNNYNLNLTEFVDYFQTHPDYPNLSAIENTLNFFQIENIVLQFENEDFENLPNIFITSLKSSPNDLILINKNANDILISEKNNQNFKLKTESFLKQWSGIVLAIEENEEKTNAESRKLNNSFKLSSEAIFVIINCLILGYSLWKFTFPEILYTVISLIGLYYCFEIFKNQHGKDSIILNKICNDAEKDKSSCQKIMQSDKTNIWGLKLADVALYYFFTTTIFSLFGKMQFLILCLSVLCFPVIGYSLYIQLIKERKLCKICLTLIVILLIQIVISLLYFSFDFSIETLFYGLLYVSVTLPLYIYINKILNSNRKLEKDNILNLRFKRNYGYFKAELYSESPRTFNKKDCFFIGNKDAKIHITLVSNLECKFCAEAHDILKYLYSKNNDNISFQIRFNFPEGIMPEYVENIFKILLYSYSVNELFFMNVLGAWYESMDYKKFIKKFGNLKQNFNLQSILEIKRENILQGLNFTPIFLINEYVFPQNYERNDIIYFIQDLIDDEEI